MKSIYEIANDALIFLLGTIKRTLQPKYEYFDMATDVVRKTNIDKIYYRAENVAIIFETPSGECLTSEDLTIEQIFVLAVALEGRDYTIESVYET